MVVEFAEERKVGQAAKIELEKVRKELAEEKQKRGSEVVALEQENTSEIMAGVLKEQQIKNTAKGPGFNKERIRQSKI